MQQFSAETQNLIQKLCKGKTHMKLTIGTLVNGEANFKMFGADSEMPYESQGYEIGSMTKTFVGALLAKYINEGKMSLDDPISNYVNGLDTSKYYPTLKRLVTHTAGYGSIPITRLDIAKFIFNDIFKGSMNGGKLPPFNMDLERMTKLLCETTVEDKDYPWKYSNFGIGVLGYAIGQVSGKGYWNTMNDFVQNELGLTQTFTGNSPNKILQGYDRKNRNIGNWEWGNDYLAPAGDLRSTAADLLTYARINMNEETPYLAMTHKKYADLSKEWDQGLGWLQNPSNHNVIYGMGGTGAFYSFLGIDKQEKVACIVLSNYLIDLKHTLGRAILKDLQEATV